jgi:hypothetical protein
VVGVAGTYLQNLGRVIGLLVVGHVQGAGKLWAAHEDAGYVLFIAWYALFVAAYLWVAMLARTRDSPGVCRRAS